MTILDEAKTKMKAAIEHLKTELKSIRTGRANASMLDAIHIEVYGTNMRLRDIAGITAPEARQLLVSPYDASNIHQIRKGLEASDLGYQAIVDGNVIRINIPQMNEELRKEMAKICHKKREESKIGVRHIRRDFMDMIKSQKSSGDLSEDVVKRLEKEIQELTDHFCKEVDDIAAQKEKEVMTI